MLSGETHPRSMEKKMKHPIISIKENMFGLLECTLVQYANLLRQKYPKRTIRNAAVFASAIPEFARLGYIELVDNRIGIPNGIPEFMVHSIKRMRRQPIWIPGINFPRESFDIFDQMKPFIRDDEVVWRHVPPRRFNTWRMHMRRHKPSGPVIRPNRSFNPA